MSLHRLIQLLCLLLVLPLVLNACIRPHKATINQGNLVNKKDFERLELGMTREQVEFLIGRPILIEPFEADHWEYVYLAYRGYDEPIKKKMILQFKNEQLVKINGTIVDTQDHDKNVKKED